jgi:protein-glutamine gamma-glutamyltransferase
MRRNVLLSALAGVVLAVNWLRLEHPQHAGWRVPALVVLAIAPTLVRRRAVVVAAVGVATVCGLALAFSVSPSSLWPNGAGFFRPVGSRFAHGFQDFYSFRLPIDPGVHDRMHMLLLAAIFLFTLSVALAVAAGRALPAVLLFLVGAGWPATLLAGGQELLRGGVILGAALVLLAGLTGSAGRFAAPAAAAVVVGALTLSSSPAVAKSAFLDWQRWNPYAHTDKPVSVSYVWNSSYAGIRFPRQVTPVLSIAAPQAIGTYWRATVLDVYAHDRWIEQPWRDSVRVARQLTPAAAQDRKNDVRQVVTVDAFRDRHLVGASIPVGISVTKPAAYVGQNVALSAKTLDRGYRYTVESYVAQPSPEQLVRVAAVYPRALTRPGRELEIAPGVTAPPFGAPGRDDRLARALTGPLSAYVPLLRRARAVAGNTRSPYAATVALERWLRTTGGFSYSSQPPATPGLPPLVGFVLQTRTGYCQHFSGAMALMLRMLGIPARVAAGFVSGRYSNGTWTVTDHDAHTWVEVWFRGYGWLPFDPTPGRGRLGASYTAASSSFNAAAAAKLLERLVRGGEVFGPGGKKSAVEKRGRTLNPARHPGGKQSRVAGTGRPSLGRFLALLALGVLGAILLAKLVRRRARYLTHDPRRIAAACGRELGDFLVDQRLPVRNGATFRELADALSSRYGVEAESFADAAESARFGRPEAAPEAAAQARRELSDLKARLRRRLLVRNRARGLVSLRSLGFS